MIVYESTIFLFLFKGKKKIGSAKSGVVIPEEPKEVLLTGCSAVCAMSQSILYTGAALKKCQPYEYINSFDTEEVCVVCV